MIIYPAIDLMNQKVVRLKKGDFTSMKIYKENPLLQAKTFFQQGASFLHIIDLDGAKTGIPNHVKLLKDIKKETSIRIQYGGGLRKEKTILNLLEEGIDKVILGSFAMMHQDVLKRLVSSYPDRIVVAVDFKDGKVTYAGWQRESLYEVSDYLTILQSLGVTEVLLTDISKDGMLEGIDVSFYQSLKETFPTLKITASGGVTTLKEVQALKKANIDGCIIGVALYEEVFTLEEALAC